MNLLPSTVVTTAVTAVTTTPTYLNATPRNLTVQCNFVYGSSGTTVTVWVQTSLDGQSTWTDVAAFGFTTASARKGVNFSTYQPAGTPAGATGETTPIALTDGSMSSNTALDGIMGPYLRIKYTTTGTYAGSTSIQVDVQSADINVHP